MTTSIEKIREQVQGVRKLHLNGRPDLSNEVGYCSSCARASAALTPWPCQTLRLAEDKLKLAEGFDAAIQALQRLNYPETAEQLERILVEVAE